MLETVTVAMAPTFDRSLPVTKFDKFESGKSVWDAGRSIWADNSAEPDSSRPTTARHNSTSSNKFSKAMNGSALSVIENPRNNMDNATWGDGSGPANNIQNGNFTSPTKRKQSGWLFDSKAHDVENTSSLLAGSAPEFEPFGERGQETLGTARPTRLSNESITFEHRFAPSLRSTGPAQLPAPNRFLSQAAGTSQGTQQLRQGSTSIPNTQDYRSRNDLTLSTHISPPASRGMATATALPNPNSISPTTSRTQRNMQNYLQRTVDEATEGFRSLNVSKFQAPYEKPSYAYDTARPIIHNEDDITYWNGQYNYGGYGRPQPHQEQQYYEQQTMPAWAHWELPDAKVRPDQTHDYRNGPSSPYHALSLTPSSNSDSIRSAVASRNSHHDVVVANRRGFSQDDYYSTAYMNNGMLIPQGVMSMDMTRGYMNPMATPYHMSNYLTGPKGFIPRDDQRPVVARSAFLEEFRIHKTTKRYELRDLFGYIVEFSGDQHGSRFIQHKLETANSDEKDQIFREIQSDALPLMTDVFGNYVIQKLFEHGSQSQKKMLAEQMKSQISFLSTQMYGCRVVQKALEHVLTDQQASMVKELDGPNKAILKTIKDQNGNHVVQKAIERVPAEHIQFIIDAHKGETVKLAQHTYGCRVIQRILEFCTPAAKRVILDELHSCVAPLITDQFGNYVIQHVISRGEPEDRRRVVLIVMQQLTHFSKHKFASNVVEKALEYADEDQQSRMFAMLTQPDATGVSPVFGYMRDQYGNYVIQKVLALLEGPQHEMLLTEMRGGFPTLKRISYGKQVTALEKVIFPDHQPLPISNVAHNSGQMQNNGQMVARPMKR